MKKSFILFMILTFLISPFTFGPSAQAAGDENIALGKPAISDSELAGYEAGNALDSDEWNTHWTANDGSFPHWLEVDLQGAYDLSGATVIWNAWSYINQYTIEVSRDHKVWTTVVDKSQSSSVEQTQYNAFKLQNVSYVRVNLTGINGGKWAAINDLKVWGVPAAGTPHEPVQGEIQTVLPVRLDTEIGQAPELPSVVTVVYSNSDTEDAQVAWDVILPAEYSRPGTFTVSGSISGTVQKAVAKVTVVGDSSTPIVGFESINVSTITDVPALLPSAVTAIYEDGSSKQLPVTWDDLIEAEYAVEGTYSVMGKVAGTDLQPTADIQVTPLVLQSGFIKGADISTLEAIEDAGGKYYDNGVEKDLMDILKSRGVNYIRLRLWNDPQEAGGYNDREDVVEMAQRVKAKGFKLLLDFHYSDFWADPGKQNKPGAWADYSYDELKQAVYDYTKDVMDELKEKGASPDMVQIGNEINGGLLWPDGKSYDQENAFEKVVPLLESGVKGVRDSQSADQDIKIMIHLAEGGKNDMFRWFFDELTKRNLDYDVIGASFYPYWSGTMDSLQFNLDDISKRYGKEVIVTETAYPYTLQDGDNFENNIARQDQLDGSGFPATVAGQMAEVKTVMNVLSKVPDGKGTGLFYWEPAWIPVQGVGWKVGEGNAWENQAMFDFAGNALSSLNVFKTPVAGEGGEEEPGTGGNPGTGGEPGTGGNPDTGEEPGTGVNPDPVITVRDSSVVNSANKAVVEHTAAGQLQVKAQAGISGIADITLSIEDINKALSTLPADEKLIISVLPSTGELKGAVVHLPLSSILEQGKHPQIVIVYGAASVTVSTEASAGIIKTGAKELTLSLVQVATPTLPSPLATGAKDYPAYNIHVSVDGTSIDVFKKGAISVAFHYKLKLGEQSQRIAVYSILADGKLEVIKAVRYNPTAEQIVFNPSHFSIYAAGYAEVGYTDLKAADWATLAIESLTAKGIVQGIGNGIFNPQGEVTRAEFVSMLLSALELKAERGTGSFKDVNLDAWYSSVVITAGKLGVVQGHADGTFGPNDKLSREEMAAISYRALKLVEKVNDQTDVNVISFKDKDLISMYASEGITALAQAGIINGFEDGNFRPQAHTTRAEAAYIILNLLQQ
ncbi:glycosyl hydrolase 53 family protein [Paenibacillus odorifer]|uniref:glycosyl hydrolase 53 family protein n=1 Tax=Paenibacillus odorifer TaxID=189426 RepID=UPI002DB841E2|nr:glycosyl hydrolase 53 family protein [Paenibacillus odorifer]MEC0132697.1 glycosyl hydrolase 53 family protein [Paenibacillus odorifer]MEC0224552.1 glycosyl hydrolase 53 family protein [Paenibacillus odorifer]